MVELHISSEERNWMALANCFMGETCLVIGNGPSLKDIPLSFLNKYFSFGTNRIYLLDGFKPSFYVCVNPLVAKQSIVEIIELDASVSFMCAEYAPLVPGALPLHSFGIPNFSRNPSEFIYEGYTVTYVCLQLAFFMGFERVLLVGVDHSYLYSGQPNEERVAEGNDPNHFHPEYFSNGTVWNNPDLDQSERAYRMARHAYDYYGREVINVTPGSKLEVFRKDDWRKYE